MPPQNTTTRFPGCQKISLRIKKFDRFPGGEKEEGEKKLAGKSVKSGAKVAKLFLGLLGEVLFYHVE